MDYYTFIYHALPGTVAEMSINDEAFIITIPYRAFKTDRMIMTINTDDNTHVDIEIFPSDGATFKIIKSGTESELAMH